MSDWVLLSTKDLKFQIKGKHSEKLMEQFVGPYKVKRIIVMRQSRRKLFLVHSST